VYSSLDRVDIVANGAGGSGKLFVQTDHRDASEVAGELEISVLFALTRTLMPRRMPDGKTAIIRYACIQDLHPKLAEVLASTGAAAESKGATVSLEGVRRRPPADLADEAFAALGKRVLAKHDLRADEEGLRLFEAMTTHAPPAPRHEDGSGEDIPYWTTVAELAAVTGEVLRAKYGGRWVDDPKDFADIPFMFEPARNAGLLNPVGKAIKFLRHGAAESPRQLIQLVEDAGTPEGPLLFTLKPARWDGDGQACSEPLVSGMEVTGEEIPVIVYGRDQPNTFALFMKDGEREKRLPAMRAEALANLGRIDVQVERIALDRLTFWVVQGGYFAAEKVLDVAFMKSMHERMKAQMLAVAVPAKGQLLVTDAIAKPETILGFMAIARGIYEKNEGGRQLSPTVFMCADGVLQGVAKATPPEKTGFFKKLFS
jgi:hypothetical protein